MDVSVDMYLAVPLLFTVLALVLASVFVKLRGGGGQRAEQQQQPQPEPQPEPGEEQPGSAAGGEAEPQGTAEGPGVEGGRVPVEEVGATDEGKEEKEEEKEKEEEAAAQQREAAGPEQSPASIAPRQPPAAAPREQREEEEEEADSKEEDLDSESEKLVVREPEDEDAADETFSFKYSPGKLRGNQYKSMMTKEELEEEQRTEDYMKLSLASS